MNVCKFGPQYYSEAWVEKKGRAFFMTEISGASLLASGKKEQTRNKTATASKWRHADSICSLYTHSTSARL